MLNNAVQVSWTPLPVVRVTPWLDSLHQDLEVVVGGSGVLHHDLPESDVAATRALSLAPHVEHASSGGMTKIGPDVRNDHHSY